LVLLAESAYAGLFPSSWPGSEVENMLSDDISGASQQQDQKPRGRPFPPGVSGCPGGRLGRMKRLRAEQEAMLSAHQGHPPTPVQAQLVEQLVAMKMAKPRSTADVVKVANTTSRLLDALYGSPQPAQRRPLGRRGTAPSFEVVAPTPETLIANHRGG
jgi:hypothetical protein